MSGALTPPLVVAALVVLIAGLAKLRSPAEAAEALAVLGLTGVGPAGRERAVRGLALAELAVAAATLYGDHVARVALGVLYSGFALAALGLLRRGGECGCFGESTAPASPIHPVLNLAFAAVCLTVAARHTPGLTGLAGLPAWQWPAALLGIAAATGASVLAYTELPRAWRAWTGGAG